MSADLENGFADDPDGVADTVTLRDRRRARRLLGRGLLGGARSTTSGSRRERVAAAAEAAHAGDVHLVLTARAENHIRGNADLDDTIARLQAYQAAGADVLFAPGLAELDDIRRVVARSTARERARAAECTDGRRARAARA